MGERVRLIGERGTALYGGEIGERGTALYGPLWGRGLD